MKPRLMLADDQPEIRHDLRRLLEAGGWATVVAEAANGKEVLARLDRVRCDAVLMDLSMPVMSGFDVLRRLSRRPFHPPVVALTVHDDAHHVDRALALGAAGYVLKSARPEDIMTSVDAALAGGTYVQPAVARGLVRRHLAVSDTAGAGSTKSSISPRQLDLLRALALGLENKEIATRLGIGEETVKGYLKELYARIGVTSRAAAVAWALRSGTID